MSSLIPINLKKRFELNLIIGQWKEGLISNSEVLTKLLMAEADPDTFTIALCNIIQTMREQEEKEANSSYVDPKDSEEWEYLEAGGDEDWADHEDDCCPHCDKPECKCKNEI